MDKGTYGYIRHYKKKKLLYTCILLLILLAIFIIGYKVYQRKVYAIISVVLILPMAKYAVAFLIALPFKSIGKEDYYDIENKKGNGATAYDCILSSGEKIMNVDCMYVDDKNISLLITKSKQDLEYIAKYIQEYCEGRLYSRKAKAYLDKDKFIDAIKGNNSQKKDENSEIVSEILMLHI